MKMRVNIGWYIVGLMGLTLTIVLAQNYFSSPDKGLFTNLSKGYKQLGNSLQIEVRRTSIVRLDSLEISSFK